MTREVWADTLAFVKASMAERADPKLRVTFHGGEPLVVGLPFLERALADLAEAFPDREIAVQSNLWLLDDAFCGLFREHGVALGTSLDGPRTITDAQRGLGYYDRTMAGIQRAREHGLRAGCVATFTRSSAPRWREIFDFFLHHDLGFAVHAALPSFEHPSPSHALPPGQFADLLVAMLPYYIEHGQRLSVSPFDEIGQTILTGRPAVCTFGGCLGTFLAIGPQGDLYPCQRFVGAPAYALGSVQARPLSRALEASPAARRVARWHAAVSFEGAIPGALCGCPYNAFAAGDETAPDPYCRAWEAAFEAVRTRLLNEAASEENIAALGIAEPGSAGLFCRGRLIDHCLGGAPR